MEMILSRMLVITVDWLKEIIKKMYKNKPYIKFLMCIETRNIHTSNEKKQTKENTRY